MFPECSVMMSLIILISQETVEKLEWAALLWILMLAKARSGPSRTGIADIRSDHGQASNAVQRQNQRNPGGREAEGQLAASLARCSPLRGCASLAPCHLPVCLHARPIPFFQKSPKLPLPLRLVSRSRPQRAGARFLSCRARVLGELRRCVRQDRARALPLLSRRRAPESDC